MTDEEFFAHPQIAEIDAAVDSIVKIIKWLGSKRQLPITIAIVILLVLVLIFYCVIGGPRHR